MQCCAAFIFTKRSHDTLCIVGKREREIRELKEKLQLAEDQRDLANDKMAEQARRVRWEVADDIVNAWLDPSYKTGDDLVAVAKRIRDANAPKG